MDQLNNNRILKNILPFLAIFVASLSYAGFSYIQDIAGGAKASDNYDVEITSLNAPLSTTDQWNWNIIVFNKTSNNESNLSYKVSWCSETKGAYGDAMTSLCKGKERVGFFNELTSNVLTSEAKEAIYTIKHQSVDCGSVEVEINDGTELIKTSVRDTGNVCSNSAFGVPSISRKKKTDLDVLSRMYCNFNICDGEVEEPDDVDEEGNEITPGPEDPENPPIGGQDPVPPSERPSSAASHAVGLAQFILDNCSGGRVDGRNSLCVSKLNIGSLNDRLASDKVKRSADTFHAYGGLQCVGFVKGAIAAQQGLNSNHSGNARSYATNRDPYTFHSAKAGALPQVNDLAVWTYTGVVCEGGVDCGHIAYVTRVEGNAFFVAEANRGCNGCVRIHRKLYRTTDKDFGGFLRL